MGKKEDGRKNNGGHKNAGRKSKVDEQQLVEKLSPLESSAFKALKKGLDSGQNWAVKLYFEYSYGKAKEFKEIDLITNNLNITIGE